MDYLTKQQAAVVRERLLKKHKELQIAAKKANISVVTMSRVINGKHAKLSTLIAVLKMAGLLNNKEYAMPKEDLKTFYRLNGMQNLL